MNKVLIIDDDQGFCRTIQKRIKKLGITADYETRLHEGFEKARQKNYDIVLLDVNLPDGSGLEIIPKLRFLRFAPEIIIITGRSDKSGAETAIKSGAWDYIEKSSSFQNIKLSLIRVIQYREQKKTKPVRIELKRDKIIGHSRLITACLDKVGQFAPNESPVLITGETGTGKELFAYAIHQNSYQSSGAFVIVDCAALPEHLVESTLFGHKKGAFTGAENDQIGLIEQADGGTLFLDEIGELDLEIQKKFLRVLQMKRFRPIGEKTEKDSEFRLISATHRNLLDMVETKIFREDLYYRISSMKIDLPPLRDRLDDIPSLVLSHLKRNKALSGTEPHSISTDFLEILQAYQWPGNVRELFNIVDRALAAAIDEPMLFPSHLPTHMRINATQGKISSNTNRTASIENSGSIQGNDLIPMRLYIEKMKIHYLVELINITNGDIRSACRKSGLSRAYLYQLLKKYKIRHPKQT